VIAPKRGGVRQEEMCNHHRLRTTQVCVGRHQRVAARLGLTTEHANEIDDSLLDLRHASLQVEAEIERHLFVARSPGMKPAAGVADASDEFTLDERMDVFVLLRRGRGKEVGIVGAGSSNLLERTSDRRGVRRRQHAGLEQRLCPREAARHVILEQTAIELE
jgi:hypothetical protein